MKNIITNSEDITFKYKKYLKNKRVVLVGPGWHTKNTKQHDLIESYDVVVRLNDGYKLIDAYREDLGSRTDILYVSLSIYYFKNKIFTSKTLKKFKKQFKWISVTSGSVHRSCAERLRKFDKRNRPPIYCVEKNIYDSIKKETKKKLSTSVVAIKDLLEYDIKELYITGITFYHKGVSKTNKQYRSNYSNRWVSQKHHNFSKELSYFVDLCKNDKRIKCDHILTRIVQFVTKEG